jgi:hypothetical protein
LAVDDIKAVQEQAALNKMAMQVNRKNRFYLIVTPCHEWDLNSQR